MKCPECGNKITPKARFCDACGAALPQKKKPTIKDYFVTIIFLIIVIFLISLFFPKKEKDPAPEPSAALAPASASVPAPSRPSLSEYVDAYLDGTAREYFGDGYDIEIVAEKEIILTVWIDGLKADIDALKAGKSEAVTAWHDLRDSTLTTSKQITSSMREVSTAGSYCTIFLVNEFDRDDVFLIVSNGMLYYDCEIDRDPDLLYKMADQ